jgi:ATP-dependent DNA helicase RecQ
LQSDDINNPLNDAKKARDLFFDEVTAFNQLDENLKKIYYTLLSDHREFQDFFVSVDYAEHVRDIDSLIKTCFFGKICENAPVAEMAINYPVELSYALALINATDRYSITPPWVLKNFPRVENIIHFLASCSDSATQPSKEKLQDATIY